MPDVSTDRFPEPVLARQFLEKKIDRPTEKWDALKWGEHAHAFTVAHSNEAAVLDTIHGLLNKAVKDGLPFQAFKNGMLDMMKATGWYGGAGHTANEKKYINWRIKTMYETNMRTAYAQSRYRKQLEGAALRPIWVYQSQLAGKNRRQEHIALHGKAYRYDDPFWDTYYPPNGWGCQCYVTTKSEAGAERDGIKAVDSAKDDLPEIDESWAYNVGKEALAPNFAKYKNLPKETLKTIKENYRRDMEGNKLSLGELKILKGAMETKGYQYAKRQAIMYQAGSLDKVRQNALELDDCKIMVTEEAIHHGLVQKNEKQKIKPEHIQDTYNTISEPDEIYENMNPKYETLGREFHFVKKLANGKIINIVLRKRNNTALKITTMGEIDDHHKDKSYKKIKW